MTSLNSLGFQIDSEGITPTTNNIKEIEYYPYHKDENSLRRFLGMVRFYRKLIPKFAELILPLKG